MKKIILIITACGLLTSGGCLSRTYYYAPDEKTIVKCKDGLSRGAVKEEGQYPWWSDAPAKSFANPSFSIIGK